MHKNELVLVDRFNGVVYSSSERTSSNDLVQVGQLVKGQIVLKPTLLPRRDPVTIHAEKKHDPVATATRKVSNRNIYYSLLLFPHVSSSTAKSFSHRTLCRKRKKRV